MLWSYPLLTAFEALQTNIWWNHVVQGLDPINFEPNMKARWFRLVRVIGIGKGVKKLSNDLYMGRRDSIPINPKILKLTIRGKLT